MKRPLVALTWLGAFVLPVTALAEVDEHSRESPPPAGGYAGCVHASVGVLAYQTDGFEYTYKESHTGPLADLGGGACGPHTELVVRLRLSGGSGYSFVAPAVVFRLHTRSPEAAGFEAGLSIRAGVNFVHDASPNLWPDPTFTGAGPFVSLGPDLRVWTSHAWGVTLGGDLAVGSVGDQWLGAVGLALGGVYRW